jgi:hypothetical protein
MTSQKYTDEESVERFFIGVFLEIKSEVNVPL